MVTEQIAVRIPAELLAELDELVRRGAYQNRAAAVRAGIEAIARIEREQALDRAIIAGYHRFPATSVDDQSALASLRDAIADEPW